MPSTKSDKRAETVAEESNISTVVEALIPTIELFHADASIQSGNRPHDELPCSPSALTPAAQDTGSAREQAGTRAIAPAMDRIERTRQINREAQARYRNRLKVSSEPPAYPNATHERQTACEHFPTSGMPVIQTAI